MEVDVSPHNRMGHKFHVVAISLTQVLLACMPMSVNAAPDKVQYELQERCAKRAEQIFSRDWPHGSPDNSMGY
jgi:hypothetical protein